MKSSLEKGKQGTFGEIHVFKQHSGAKNQRSHDLVGFTMNLDIIYLLSNKYKVEKLLM